MPRYLEHTRRLAGSGGCSSPLPATRVLLKTTLKLICGWSGVAATPLVAMSLTLGLGAVGTWRGVLRCRGTE
jgi:hypothetical protein